MPLTIVGSRSAVRCVDDAKGGTIAFLGILDDVIGLLSLIVLKFTASSLADEERTKDIAALDGREVVH